jgi:hypothetical protein
VAAGSIEEFFPLESHRAKTKSSGVGVTRRRISKMIFKLDLNFRIMNEIFLILSNLYSRDFGEFTDFMIFNE